MQEQMKRCERNVKRYKDVRYIYRGCVKSVSVKTNLLSYAQGYKYNDCCDVQECIREYEKKVNKPNDLTYNCVYCVKF
jgi:hypothetical protein